MNNKIETKNFSRTDLLNAFIFGFCSALVIERGLSGEWTSSAVYAFIGGWTLPLSYFKSYFKKSKLKSE